MVSAEWLNEKTIIKLFNYIFRASVMNGWVLISCFILAVAWAISDNPIFAVLIAVIMGAYYFQDKKEQEKQDKKDTASRKKFFRYLEEQKEKEEREELESERRVNKMLADIENEKKVKKARLVNTPKVNEEKRKAKLKKLKSNNTRKNK